MIQAVSGKDNLADETFANEYGEWMEGILDGYYREDMIPILGVTDEQLRHYGIIEWMFE